MMFSISVFLELLLTSSAVCSMKVGIVGGGIGGASAAYYLTRGDNKDIEVLAFESRDYLGGRLKHTVLDGQIVELGGDAWSTTANRYIVDLANRMGNNNINDNNNINNNNNATYPSKKRILSNLASRIIYTQEERRQLDPIQDLGVGVWTGNSLMNVQKEVIERHLLDDAILTAKETAFLASLRLNYAERGHSNAAFSRIEDFLKHGNIEAYTSVSAPKFFHKVSSQIQDLFLEPLQRVIYDQSLSETHAFATLVSLTSMVGADSFHEGNSRLVEKLFAAADAQIALNTTVTTIAKLSDGTFEIISKKSDGDKIKRDVVDNVILAAPFRFLNITLPQEALIPKTRDFTHWYVTVIRAKGLNANYFGDEKVRNFSNILTTKNSSSPFNVIQQVTDPLSDGGSYWKLFSNSDVSEILLDIFVGAETDTIIVQYWPYTFPKLKPTPSSSDISVSSYQPLRIMPGILYINAMESLASAMETSIIGSRNAAAMLLASRRHSSKL